MRIKVGVLFGGMSVEHEVSVISGLQAFHSLDHDKYEGIPIYISKQGEWFTGPLLQEIDHYKDLKSLLSRCEKVVLHTNEVGRHQLISPHQRLFKKKLIAEIDVAFPVTHGTYGEDGALQGLLTFHQVPFVGSDIASSSIGMDKIVMKSLLRLDEIPVTEYEWFYTKAWFDRPDECVAQVEGKLDYPVIVKPADLGSSVGIRKADNKDELMEAIEEASAFSAKILVEKMVTQLTEVNCSVLGDYEQVQTSVCEEVMKSSDILSYQDKYMNNETKGMSGQSRVIPANISVEMTEKIRDLAASTFKQLGCSGVARIDFLIDTASNHVYVNEINTIPGSLSFYLWEPTGIEFTALTDRLIQIALKREREKSRLTLSYETNLLALHSKGGKLGSKN